MKYDSNDEWRLQNGFHANRYPHKLVAYEEVPMPPRTNSGLIAGNLAVWMRDIPCYPDDLFWVEWGAPNQ